jgi:hypothetical protein
LIADNSFLTALATAAAPQIANAAAMYPDDRAAAAAIQYRVWPSTATSCRMVCDGG